MESVEVKEAQSFLVKIGLGEYVQELVVKNKFETLTDLKMLTNLESSDNIFKHLGLPLCLILKIRCELQKLPSTSGYDKLLPYGFAIHGAICGYSRRVLWLEVLRSNKNPHMIAELYLNYVKEIGGCPQRVRTDCGTENVVLAGMQCYLRAEGLDEFAGEKSHIYGSSPANQRIEAWWSFLRRNRSSWWIDLFQDMSHQGILELGNVYHMECLWYCYHKLLQEDMEKVKDHWNSHTIRKSPHETVAGIPDILYFLPERHGAENCITEVSGAKLCELEESLNENTDGNIYQEYFEYAIEASGWFYPSNVEEAFQMFQQLTRLQQ